MNRRIVFFLKLGAIFAATGVPASAQNSDVTINLTPEIITTSQCGRLMEGFSISAENIQEASQQAATGGYRVGYVMGYVHGALDSPGKQRPLAAEELDTFIGTYRLLCENDATRSIYETAREAMGFQTR